MKKRKVKNTKKDSVPNIQRQELYCHECKQYVQFDLDVTLNGKHELKCPKCGHIHCRYVNDGIISEERWDHRNKQGYSITYAISAGTITYSAVSTWTTSTSSTAYLYSSWADLTSGTTQ